MTIYDFMANILVRCPAEISRDSKTSYRPKTKVSPALFEMMPMLNLSENLHEIVQNVTTKFWNPMGVTTCDALAERIFVGDVNTCTSMTTNHTTVNIKIRMKAKVSQNTWFKILTRVVL